MRCQHCTSQAARTSTAVCCNVTLSLVAASQHAALWMHPHSTIVRSDRACALLPRHGMASASASPHPPPCPLPPGAIVCTIEKANALVNRMLEEDSLTEISALVVDELHMVGDDERCAARAGRTGSLAASRLLLAPHWVHASAVPAHAMPACLHIGWLKVQSITHKYMTSCPPACLSLPQGLSSGAAADQAALRHAGG
jgi:hypothetical protein